MARRKGSSPWLRAAIAASVLLGVTGLGPRANATVAEQRARLPPPAECQDPVEGVWRAHQFWGWRYEWYVMTLEIHRAKPGAPELTGTILSEYWHGSAKDQEAPPCAQQPFHFVVRMPAVGTYREGDVAFGGTSWTLDRAVCGGRPHGYNPDRFTGKIDPKIQEFQSVNNDGGAAVNVPSVFRRVRCFDQGEPATPPSIDVKRPSFRPKVKSSGCGCEIGPGTAPGDLGAVAFGLCAGASIGLSRRRTRGAEAMGKARQRRSASSSA
jgi:hypothetical protein